MEERDRVPFDLDAVKADWLNIASQMPDEVAYLRMAILEGDINGRCYFGACCCFKGTLARGVNRVTLRDTDQVESVLQEHGIYCDAPSSPYEQFCFHILPGDIPANNPYSAQALGWCDEFLRERAKAQAPQLAEVR